MAYGNSKPPILQSAEKALWSSLLRIASGLNSRDEIGHLLKELGDLEKIEGILEEESWFIHGELDIPLPSSLSSLPSPLSNRTPAPEDHPTTDQAMVASSSKLQADPVSSSGGEDDDRDVPSESGLRDVPAVTEDETEEQGGGQSSDEESVYDPKGKGKGKLTQKKKQTTPDRRESSADEIDTSRKRKEKKKEPWHEPVAPRRLMKAPDLPLPIMPTVVKKKKTVMENTPKVTGVEHRPLSRETVNVRLFPADRDKPPIDFEFKVSVNTVCFTFYSSIFHFLIYFNQFETEYPLLRGIQASVQALFANGRPLHHLDSARSLDFSPAASSCFVTTVNDFNNLSAAQVQDIFRHRHILIPGAVKEDIKFDRQGLATLGSLTTVRTVQGE
jgi:hypothetical protein